MNPLNVSNQDLIFALTALPEREQADVIDAAIERRDHMRASVTLHHPVTATGGQSREDCCGLKFTSQAGRVICPLCGKSASATRSPAPGDSG